MRYYTLKELKQFEFKYIDNLSIVSSREKGIVFKNFSPIQVFTQNNYYSSQTLENRTILKKYNSISAVSIIIPNITFQSWNIYLGHPTKKTMQRKKDLLKSEQQYLKYGELDG